MSERFDVCNSGHDTSKVQTPTLLLPHTPSNLHTLSPSQTLPPSLSLTHTHTYTHTHAPKQTPCNLRAPAMMHAPFVYGGVEDDEDEVEPEDVESGRFRCLGFCSPPHSFCSLLSAFCFRFVFLTLNLGILLWCRILLHERFPFWAGCGHALR